MFKYRALLTIALVITLCAAADNDPLALLQSASSLEDKAEACRLISISGDASAVPLLEPMLADEELSHMARYALEPMPGDEVDAALRRALSASSGVLKAGVISSLGIRRDSAAVPELIAALKDNEECVGEAAARALGRIASPESVKALKATLAQPNLSYAFAQALGDGLFIAAETVCENGNAAEAAKLYDTVYSIETLPIHLRVAALRGAMLASKPKKGRALLLDALKGDNAVFFAAALRTAQEMKLKGRAASEIAELLPAFDADRKIQVLQLLGELGNGSAAPLVLKEAESGPTPVRVAALGTLTRLGYAPAVQLLVSLVNAEDEALAKAARDGLSYFPGRKGDAAIKDMLQSDDAPTRLIAVELVSQGALPNPADLLMQVSDSDAEESVRIAAIKGVRDYAGKAQMPGLMRHLLEAKSNDEMIAAEQGLTMLCAREKNAADQGSEEVLATLCQALTTSESEKQRAILRVLTSTGSQTAFDTVLSLATTGEGDIKAAASRAVCEWPALLALPTLMQWVKTPPNDTDRVLAMRGAVRLLMLGQDAPEVLCGHYAELLALAASPNEKKLILSGLAKVGHALALSMALEQFSDEAVKEEAVLASIAISKELGENPEDAAALNEAKSLIPELRDDTQK